MGNYVISIKRVKDYSGEPYENPVWEYASYDRYSGPMATGYPCFDYLSHAITFDTVEEAEEKFVKWWDGFVYGHSTYLDNYDISSLAVRKVTFSTKKKLVVK